MLPKGAGWHQRPTRKLFKEGKESLEHWHDVFIKCCDPTEYKAAIELCGTWKEWNRFKREWPGFNIILDVWLQEVEVKIRSDAVLSLISKAKNDPSSAKFLAEGKYRDKPGPGKPPKRLIEREKSIKHKVTNIIDLEVERVLNPDVIEYAAKTTL